MSIRSCCTCNVPIDERPGHQRCKDCIKGSRADTRWNHRWQPKPTRQEPDEALSKKDELVDYTKDRAVEAKWKSDYAGDNTIWASCLCIGNKHVAMAQHCTVYDAEPEKWKVTWVFDKEIKYSVMSKRFDTLRLAEIAVEEALGAKK